MSQRLQHPCRHNDREWRRGNAHHQKATEIKKLRQGAQAPSYVASSSCVSVLVQCQRMRAVPMQKADAGEPSGFQQRL